MHRGNIVLPTIEVSWDPETAIELGVSWGIRHFELKALWEGRRVPDVTSQQLQHLKKVVADYGVDVVAVSPGLFLGAPATAEAAREGLREKLPRTIEFAHEFGRPCVIVFGFARTEGVGESFVVDHLAAAAAILHQAGLTAVIEPIAGSYCDSGHSMRRVIDAAGAGNLRVNWDPANIAAAEHCPFPNEYEPVKDLVSYVHLKNYTGATKQMTLFETGDIDLRANLARLKQDGYDGYLSLETHVRFFSNDPPPVAANKRNYDVLVRWIEGIEAARPGE